MDASEGATTKCVCAHHIFVKHNILCGGFTASGQLGRRVVTKWRIFQSEIE